jgi:hypothetical protein
MIKKRVGNVFWRGKGHFTRLRPAMAALTGEVFACVLAVSAFAGGLSARAALSVRSIALPEPLCEDCEPERGL